MMVDELRGARLFADDNGRWKTIYSNNILEMIGFATGVDITRKRYTKAGIRKLIAQTKP